MVKKVMALVLSLLMVFSLMADFSVVMAATEGTNEVKIRYFSDEALQNQVTSVKKGDLFYAAVLLNHFTKLNAMTISVAYNTELVELVDFSESGNPVQIDNTDPFIGDKDYLNGTLGIKQINLSNRVKASAGAEVPALHTASGKGFITLTWITMGTNTVSFDFSPEEGEGFACAIFAFRAKKRGSAEFIVPVENQDDVFDTTNPAGLEFNKVDGDDTDYYDATEANRIYSPLSITTEQLSAPDVTFADGVISWSEVNKATGYIVRIRANKGAEDTYEKTFEVGSTTLSMNLPDEVPEGNIFVSVLAKGDDSQDIADSEYSTEKTGLKTVTLTKPASVEWEGEKIKWAEVSKAESYEVTLKLNGAPVSGYPKNVGKVTELTLVGELVAPSTGVNSYVVTVKAIGDGTYVFDSADAKESVAKKICGNVKSVLEPKWSGNKATWTENDDKANVAGYKIVLKQGSKVVYTTPDDALITGSEFVFPDEYIAQPGQYTFTVQAIGGSTAEGDFGSAAPVPSENTKTVTKTLDKVTDITWNERALTWTDSNDGHTSYYEVKLYKGTETEPVFSGIVYEPEIDFDEKGADIGAGTYKVEIVAMGDNTIYLHSEKAESTKEFTARLDAPQNVKWVDSKATWSSVANARAYEVALYYNGVDTAVRKTIYEPSNEADFEEPEDELIWPGEYTFTVKALGNSGYSSSKVVESDNKYTNVEPTTGNVYIEVYEDAECTVPATNVKVGDVFYAAVAVEGVAPFMSFSAPVKFNPDYVKVVDQNNAVINGAVTEGSVFVDEDFDIIENESEDISEIHPYIDNTNGLVKIAAVADSTMTLTEKKNLVVIKMMAIGKSDSNELKFAVANAENPNSYDYSSMSGFEMAGLTGILFATNNTPVVVAIAKGQVAKPNAPAWNGSTLTWDKAEGNSVTGYEIELYRDGTLVDTIAINDKNITEESLSAYTTTGGNYTARIKVTADGIGADSSEYSELSDEYTVRFGGGRRPKKDPVNVTPVTPVTPVKPEFTDIAGHWAEEDIKELVDLGIVDGYGDNTYRPDLGITRAEFTKLMVTCLGAELKGEAHIYGDTENHWAKDYIAIGTELGIVNGIGENLFAPDEIITREQIAAIIYRMAGKPEAKEAAFADRDDITEYAKKAVDYVAENKVMIGFEDNTFRGQGKTNRAQMAAVTLRLYKANFFANYKN